VVLHDAQLVVRSGESHLGFAKIDEILEHALTALSHNGFRHFVTDCISSAPVTHRQRALACR
jgi:hypothetical protein